MINDNTILSSFNDRPTLLEWLKKVEEALKTDTATGVSVENPSVNSYIFKITFADGKTIASDPVKLPDSVKGVSISNNHLIITTQGGIMEDLGVINPYADTIVLNSGTNTTEIKNNLQVNGSITASGKELNAVVANPTEETTETLSSVKIGNTAYAVGGGGLKLWLHKFKKGPSTYGILMFTNKNASQLSSSNPCLPLDSSGPSVIDVQYLTGILLVQGSSIFLTYIDISGAQPRPTQLNISDFTETITEYEP